MTTVFRFWAARACLLAAMAIGLAACSGSNSSPTPTGPSSGVPSTPTPAPTPTPTPAPSGWTLAGDVIATSGARLGGALLQFAGLQTTTDAAGHFSIQHQAAANTELVLSHPSILERRVWLRGSTNRPDLTLDPIALSAPFDLDFYNQMVRNARDGDGTEPWRRWTIAPSFYIQTVDTAGNEVDAQTVAAVISGINEAVPQYSPYRPAAIETDAAERGQQNGWVVVTFEPRPRDDFQTCGTGTVGGNSGRIRLWLDRCRTSGETRVSRWVVLHEVGHVMGFWHTVGGHVMNGIVDYGVRTITEKERYHAAIAYRRPYGNTAPDTDPPSALSSTAEGRPPVEVWCGS